LHQCHYYYYYYENNNIEMPSGVVHDAQENTHPAKKGADDEEKGATTMTRQMARQMEIHANAACSCSRSRRRAWLFVETQGRRIESQRV